MKAYHISDYELSGLKKKGIHSLLTQQSLPRTPTYIFHCHNNFILHFQKSVWTGFFFLITPLPHHISLPVAKVGAKYISNLVVILKGFQVNAKELVSFSVLFLTQWYVYPDGKSIYQISTTHCGKSVGVANYLTQLWRPVLTLATEHQESAVLGLVVSFP